MSVRSSSFPQSGVTSLRLLGAVDVRSTDDHSLATVVAQPKRFALLCYLAIERPTEFHRRDSLIALFWPDMDQERARAGLRRALHFLRGALGSGLIVNRGDDELRLDAAQLSCDLWAFNAAIATGDYERALDLYAGELMAGVHVDDLAEWSHWLDAQRDRVRRQAAEAALNASTMALRAGDASIATRFARRAVELEPDDERCVRQLLTSLDASGDRAGALDAYRTFAERLTREFGCEPAAETVELIQHIRTRASTPAGPPPEQAVQVIDVPNAGSIPVPEPFRPEDARRRPTRASQSRRPFIWLAIAAVVAALWVGVRAHAMAPGEGNADVQHVVIFPFAVRGDPRYDYLREGSADLLSVSLDGAASMRTVDPKTVDAYLAKDGDRSPSVAEARSIIRRVSGDRFVLGDVVGTPSHLVVSAYLYDASGKEIARARAEARDDSDVARLHETLARTLVRGERSGAAAELERDATTTTASLPALKTFLAGERLFRGGNYIVATDDFVQAIVADSDFALAWYRLSTSAQGASDAPLAQNATRRAMQLVSRLPARDRLLLAGRDAAVGGEFTRAEALFRTVAARYADDAEAWQQLGEIAFHVEPWRGRPITEAAEPFARLLALDPRNFSARLHLARLMAAEGRASVVDTLATRGLALHPEAEHVIELAALRAFVSHDTAAQRRLIDSVQASAVDPLAFDSPIWLAGWRVAGFTDDPTAGRAFASVLTRAVYPVHAPLLGHTMAAHMEAARGHWQAARSQLDSANRLDALYAAEVRANLASYTFLPVSRDELIATRNALDHATKAYGDTVNDRLAVGRDDLLPVRRSYIRALLDLRLADDGAFASDVRELERLSKTRDRSGEFATHLLHQARARTTWRDGNAARALAEVESGWPSGSRTASLPIFLGESYSQAWERMLRADLLAAVGRNDEALRWYDTMVEDLGLDITLQTYAHLRRATVLERMGERDDALREYRRFVALWAGADHDLQPLVQSAQASIQRLAAGR